MVVCNECGVELDDQMDTCPLCETRVIGNGKRNVSGEGRPVSRSDQEKRDLMGRMLWQIASVLLLSCVVATLVVNFAINGAITWSIYPVAICLMLLGYSLVMALWRTSTLRRWLAGWAASVIVLFALKWLLHADWTVGLALPILCVSNLTGLTVYFVLKRARLRGLNILALLFVAVTVFCLVLDGIISFYSDGRINVEWSVIVAASVLPVVVIIVFMYFRTRKNNDLQKIFHT